ncbi:hypothetical protein MUK42_03403, partial [Musa troglodytarum]
RRHRPCAHQRRLARDRELPHLHRRNPWCAERGGEGGGGGGERTSYQRGEDEGGGGCGGHMAPRGEAEGEVHAAVPVAGQRQHGRDQVLVGERCTHRRRAEEGAAPRSQRQGHRHLLRPPTSAVTH